MSFRKVISVILSVCMVTLTFSSSVFAEDKSNTIKTTESFVIEKFSDSVNDEGIYELIGTSKINSNTVLVVDQKGLPIETHLQVVEDVYDTNGVFLYSEISEQNVTNDFKNGKMKVKEAQKKLDKPQTVHTADESVKTDISKNTILTLSVNQKEDVNNNIVSKVASLDKAAEKELQGITEEQFLKIKELSSKATEDYKKKVAAASAQGNFSPLYVERAGAFDNYYNHDTSTGQFTVQGLYFYDQAPHKYEKITGSTSGSSKNAASVGTFKSYINSYEGYIIDDMEADLWPEVVGYASTIAGFALLVLGWATGPIGWVAIVLNYGGALTVFAGLTTTVYSTYARMQYSKNAQQQLTNANSIYGQFPTKFENYSFSLVDGF